MIIRYGVWSVAVVCGLQACGRIERYGRRDDSEDLGHWSKHHHETAQQRRRGAPAPACV